MSVGAGGDDQLCSGVGADPVGGAQCGIERGGQGVDLGGELAGLAFEEFDALGQGLAGDQHRPTMGSSWVLGRHRANASTSRSVVG